MDPTRLNYKHLYYFWVVAKEGSITRASEKLNLAIQTISTQLSLLEKSLGFSLFTLVGRRLELTETGKIALNYADEIFLLGHEMQEALSSKPKYSSRLIVGIADVLPKLIVYRLLKPLLQLEQQTHLICYEGKFEFLLSELAMHKLDVILTDRPASTHRNLLLYNHELGECELSFFASPALAEKYGKDFPHHLHQAPMILPTLNSAIRRSIDQWLEISNIQPNIVAEIEDSALLTTFGGSGLGLFTAPSLVTEEIMSQHNVVSIGTIPHLKEQFFAVSPERRIKHNAVSAIYENARQQLTPLNSTEENTLP